MLTLERHGGDLDGRSQKEGHVGGCVERSKSALSSAARRPVFLSHPFQCRRRQLAEVNFLGEKKKKKGRWRVGGGGC